MKKKIYNLLFILLLFTLLLLILANSKEVLISARNGLILWKDNIFPSLFIFFIITDLLINYGFIELIGELFKNVTYKLFYLPGEASFVIITSMLSGFPSSAKYIDELIENNKLTEKEAEYLLTFTHFSNPLFVIGTVGILLNNIKLSTLIWIVHALTNIVIGLLLRKKRYIKINKINIRKAINNMYIKRTNKKIMPVLTNSILKSIDTLLLLLGIITIFQVLTTLLTSVLNINILNKSLIAGILEITQGIKLISSINIPINIKASIITGFISFGGISIHTQVFSILQNRKIKYKYYLISRIIHSLISSILVYLLV